MSISNAKPKLAAAALALAVLVGAPAWAADTADTINARIASASVLSLSDLESHAQAILPQVRETKVRGLLLEVKGQDAEGNKATVILDRRSGDVMAYKSKHGKRARAAAATR